MKNDFHAYADLISLLVLWHKMENTSTVAGYPPDCPSCREYVTSRQYDDGNGAFETSERGMVAQSVGREVLRMPEPHRTAIMMLARNRATGRAVWISPKMPAGADERATLVAESLQILSLMI